VQSGRFRSPGQHFPRSIAQANGAAERTVIRSSASTQSGPENSEHAAGALVGDHQAMQEPKSFAADALSPMLDGASSMRARHRSASDWQERSDALCHLDHRGVRRDEHQTCAVSAMGHLRCYAGAERRTLQDDRVSWCAALIQGMERSSAAGSSFAAILRRLKRDVKGVVCGHCAPARDERVVQVQEQDAPLIE
jgi:hypothetical protein